MDEDDIEQYKNDLKDLKSNQKPLINMLSQGKPLLFAFFDPNYQLLRTTRTRTERKQSPS